ncbi:MAG: TetR/AcrR family transcriptional regulator [Deltaproteobacteria bacterium]|nr:MAG: TetR/AcrR family transcriptional regulator [Deltaproteobacteria bacterium]
MPRRKGPGFKQSHVIEAAIQCIEEKGAGVLGVNAVARQMGIKPPSLYNHVKGNQDLQRLVAIEGWRRLGAFVLEGDESEMDPQEALIRFGQRFREFAHQNKALYRVLSTTSLDPEDPDFAPVAAVTLGALRRMLTGLQLPEEDVVHASRFCRAAVEGFVQLELNGQFRMGVSEEDSFRWILQGVLDAVLARASAGHKQDS